MSQSVGIVVDNSRQEPIYRQIFDQIVDRIRTQTFPPGYKLPPSRTLAVELATHRNTVARAYADLEAAGFVSSAVGRGTFVERGAASVAPTSGPAPVAHLPWPSLLSRAARLDALARAERYARSSHAPSVINLARLQPSADLIPHELMRRCVDRVFADLGARAMTYAPQEGVERLRQQIAEDLVSRGIPVAADDILVTTGSQQALDLVARALIDPGDTILVEEATYSGAIDLFALAGARLQTIPSDGEGPDVASLERSARSDVKALYLMPNGQNPTGATISAERRRQIVAWSRRHGIPIIEDDYAAGLTLDPSDRLPHLRALDADVIHVSTFSKRLIPTLRIGHVVSPPALRGVLRSMKRIIDLGTSAVMQHALAEFMERGYLKAHEKKTVAEYRLRRDAFTTALRQALPNEVRFVAPTHGVLLWLELPRLDDADAAYRAALEAGVLVAPSPMSAATPGAPPGLRATFSAESTARLVEGARRLGKALDRVLARGRKQDRGDSAIEIV